MGQRHLSKRLVKEIDALRLRVALRTAARQDCHMCIVVSVLRCLCQRPEPRAVRFGKHVRVVFALLEELPGTRPFESREFIEGECNLASIARSLTTRQTTSRAVSGL